MSDTFKRPEIKSVDFFAEETSGGPRLYEGHLPMLPVLEFLAAVGSNLDKPLRPHDGLGGAFKF